MFSASSVSPTLPWTACVRIFVHRCNSRINSRNWHCPAISENILIVFDTAEWAPTEGVWNKILPPITESLVFHILFNVGCYILTRILSTASNRMTTTVRGYHLIKCKVQRRVPGLVDAGTRYFTETLAVFPVVRCCLGLLATLCSRSNGGCGNFSCDLKMWQCPVVKRAFSLMGLFVLTEEPFSRGTLYTVLQVPLARMGLRGHTQNNNPKRTDSYVFGLEFRGWMVMIHLC